MVGTHNRTPNVEVGVRTQRPAKYTKNGDLAMVKEQKTAFSILCFVCRIHHDCIRIPRMQYQKKHSLKFGIEYLKFGWNISLCLFCKSFFYSAGMRDEDLV
jgi:hypothetical protein